MNYKVQILSQDYSRIRLNPIDSSESSIDLKWSLSFKYFHDDIVKYEKEKISLKSSNISKKPIIAVLTINKKVIYGMNKKRNPYYVAMPTLKEYPKTLIALNKRLPNARSGEQYYVLLKYTGWSKKLPNASLIKVIGKVGDEKLENDKIMYEYGISMHEKRYNNKKMKVNHKSKIWDLISQKTDIPEYHDNRAIKVFSIDPLNTVDIDDAISYDSTSNTIGIHIADVSFWTNFLNLSFHKKQHFTIYQRDRKFDIFPKVFSNHLFSLKANADRLALSLFIKYADNGTIENYRFEKSIINVNKNMNYKKANTILSRAINDTPRKEKQMKKFLERLSMIAGGERDSHKIIEHFMVLANSLTAEYLIKHKQEFIIRTHAGTNINDDEMDDIRKIENRKVQQFLQYYISEKGIYRKYKPGEDYYHYGLNIKHYAQFTSPIRRTVDLYNHLLVKKTMNSLGISVKKKKKRSRKKYDFNESLIEEINNEYERSKRVHRHFDLIHAIYNQLEENVNYEAWIIGITEKQIILYFPQWNFIYRKDIVKSVFKSIYKLQHFNDKVEVTNTDTKTMTVYRKYQKITGHFSLALPYFTFSINN